MNTEIIQSKRRIIVPLEGVNLFIQGSQIVERVRTGNTSAEAPKQFDPKAMVQMHRTMMYPAAMQPIEFNGITLYASVEEPKPTVEDVVRGLAADGGNKFAIITEGADGSARLVDVLEIPQGPKTFADHLASWIALAGIDKDGTNQTLTNTNDEEIKRGGVK